MKIITKVKMQPTPEQHALLLQTLEKGNALCNRISQQAWDTQTFRRYDLQHLAYHVVRAETELAAQFVIRCIAKVADAYNLDKAVQRTFKPHGALAYDDRILSWQTRHQSVSIWTIDGRQRMTYLAGDKQNELLKHRQGESDLVYSKQRNLFYLLAVCDIPDLDEQQVDDFLGVDMGEKNLAVTSDGEIMTSEVIERNRLNHQRMRNELQAKGTKSTRRKLKQRSGKQRLFQRDVNHQISKRLVSNAVRTKRGIAVEDLTGIRARTRVKGPEQRAKRSNWAFAQLREFIEYKAKLAGVPVGIVDPAYTSQRCFECGHIEASNRKSQGEFLCQACGHAAHADVNAANNISGLMSISLMSRLHFDRLSELAEL